MPAEHWLVFLDTNVLIAGLASRTGASAAILDLGEAEEIRIVLIRQVLVEADRVFLAKFPSLIGRYRAFIKNLSPLLADDPPAGEIRKAAKVIHAQDAPILAAAKREKVDYLVTLNTRHFATSSARAFLSTPIVTPAEFLNAFRQFWKRMEFR
ncbi:MAG: PIN domain-containing protein [Candidatus Omnitrophica bacterium]|nr:PIN domain-containing protein [Candidatus Omnitrophota bacterium]